MTRADRSSEKLPEISATELDERLGRGDELALVDVREPYEREIADLPEVGQLRIPVNQLLAPGLGAGPGGAVDSLLPVRVEEWLGDSGAPGARVRQRLEPEGRPSGVEGGGGFLDPGVLMLA